MNLHLDANGKTLARDASHDFITIQELYKSYHKRIYNYVGQRVSNLQDTEDLVSDIFLRILRRLQKFKNCYRLSAQAWVFTIAHNMIIDYYRKSARNLQELELEGVINLLPINFNLEILHIERERNRRLHVIINQLPKRRREAIILKYFGGLRNLEIARVMKVDERAVASYINRGLNDLHEAYYQKFETNEDNDFDES